MRKAKWTKCSQWANMNSRKSAHLVFTCLFHQPLKNVCTILFFCVCVERQRLLTLLQGGDLLAMKGFGSRTDTRIQRVPSGRGGFKMLKYVGWLQVSAKSERAHLSCRNTWSCTRLVASGGVASAGLFSWPVENACAFRSILTAVRRDQKAY